MSKIDVFQETKKEHEKLAEIINGSFLSNNKSLIHYAKIKDIYSEIAFSFSIQSGERHSYENSERLTFFIGEACKKLKDSILKKAMVLFQQDVEKKRNAATDEAKEVLGMTEGD